ncbi:MULTISPECIES: hypothetical protein [Faecalibacterium]|uniref:hypothetical protein n=1 Tax=Faecalibacterium TaxID=216851 RepID=UPI000E4D84E4|nr:MULTISPECIES: hypothetical protein [Faecalibacterium]RHQ27601.1 hypothetical protein DWY95_08595 [Faecalibacterium sp. AF28-13AC]
MNEKRFEIDTSIGKIVAEGFVEPYPEIVIYLKRNDGETINLSSINYDSSGDIENYLWMDVLSDEYTDYKSWTSEDLTADFS